MRILVIDDEATQRDNLKGSLEHAGHEVYAAEGGDEGMGILRSRPVDVLITDLRMAGMDGLQVADEARKASPLTKVIILTAYGEVDVAVRAMRLGVFDFLTKPVDIGQLEMKLGRIQEHSLVMAENRQLREVLREQFSFDTICSVSAEMEHVLNMAARIAPSTSSVLIRGETGVGKELVARAIHAASERRGKPFVPVNCSALNEHLLESELFGHEKGAFTGAVNSRAGRFEIASGGTLFLDEIGDLPGSVQVKLLRAIQDRTVERVGSNTPIPVDVRLVTATHRDLTKEMAESRFREDLYYRLNVVEIWVPPLRQRRDDIPVLAQSFLERFTKESHRQIKGFTTEAMNLLVRHPFPGNVRELENAVERAVLLSRTEYIQPCDLPEAMQVGGTVEVVSGQQAITLPLVGDMPEAVEHLEKAMVLHALQVCNGNQTKAAKSVGISEKSVRDRLRKWGMG